LNEHDFELKIFPNPAKSKLNIQLNKADVTLNLFNQYGILVHHQILVVGINRIEIDEYLSGFYHIQLVNEEKFLGSKKIVISN